MPSMKESTLKHIRQTLDRIEQSLEEEVTLGDIASATHLSLHHFARMFRSVTGYTVMGYLRRRRLAAAAELLRESEEDILDIALAEM